MIFAKFPLPESTEPPVTPLVALLSVPEFSRPFVLPDTVPVVSDVELPVLFKVPAPLPKVSLIKSPVVPLATPPRELFELLVTLPNVPEPLEEPDVVVNAPIRFPQSTH